MQNDHRRGMLWALASAFSVAAFMIPWKIASEHGAASTNALILLAAASLLNTLLVLARQRSLPRFSRFDLLFACGLAALTLLGNTASAEAIRLISPSLLIVVQRSEVILVALLAWPVIGERVEPRYWIGAAMAIGGLWLIQQPETGSDLRSTGLAWALVAASCFSSMVVATRKYVHRIDVVAVNGLRLWISVAFWFAIHGWPAELRDTSAAQVFHASLAAFFGPFAGRLCLMMSSQYVEARITTLAQLVSPLLTLAFAWVLLADLPTRRELLGGAVLLLGVAIPIIRRTAAEADSSPPR